MTLLKLDITDLYIRINNASGRLTCLSRDLITLLFTETRINKARLRQDHKLQSAVPLHLTVVGFGEGVLPLQVLLVPVCYVAVHQRRAEYQTQQCGPQKCGEVCHVGGIMSRTD